MTITVNNLLAGLAMYRNEVNQLVQATKFYLIPYMVVMQIC